MSKPRAAEGLFYGEDAIRMRGELIERFKKEGYPAEAIAKAEQAFPLWYEEHQAIWKEPSYGEVINAMGSEPYHKEQDIGHLVFGYKDAILERHRLIECLKRSGVPEDDVQRIRRKFPVVDCKWQLPEYEDLIAAVMRVDHYTDLCDALIAYEYPDEFGKK